LAHHVDDFVIVQDQVEACSGLWRLSIQRGRDVYISSEYTSEQPSLEEMGISRLGTRQVDCIRVRLRRPATRNRPWISSLKNSQSEVHSRSVALGYIFPGPKINT
jgi:hypothetical protein